MAADEDNSTAGGDNPPAGERRQRERRQRPPVTIDLKAAPVAQTSAESAAKSETSRPAETPVPPGAPPRRDSGPLGGGGDKPPRGPTATPGVTRGSPAANPWVKMDEATARTVAAGAAGGVIALLLVIVLQAIGLIPAPGRSAAFEAAEAARNAAAATGAIDRRVATIETMVEGLPQLRSDLGALRTRLASLETAEGSLATKADVEGVVAALATVRERVDAFPVPATRADLDALTERIGRLEVSAASGGGTSAASEAAIASLSAQLSEAQTGIRTLTERLAAAEASVASLGSANPSAGGEAAVRAIAITALRRASEGSAPFLGEVDMAASLGITGSAVDQLRPLSAVGVPTEAAIAADFPATADAILSAVAAADPDAGFFDRVLSGLGGLVTIRPAGPIAGSDPSAIVSRMTAAVAAADLATAIEERNALPEAGKQASARWAAEAEARVTVDTLVDQIARTAGAPMSG